MSLNSLSSGGATEATQQQVLAALGGKPPLTKYEFSGELPIYIGKNANVSASDADVDWSITKYTWSGDTPTQIKTLTGSWTGRASLAW